jgi:hypothetical protein
MHTLQFVKRKKPEGRMQPQKRDAPGPGNIGNCIRPDTFLATTPERKDAYDFKRFNAKW